VTGDTARVPGTAPNRTDLPKASTARHSRTSRSAARTGSGTSSC